MRSSLTAGHAADAARAGGARAARLHRGVDRRVPDPGPRLSPSRSTGSFAVAPQRRRQPGRAHHRQPVQAARLRPKTAPMYAQMLVGMVALTGQWWLDARKPAREVVAAHLVNLAWNGLADSSPSRGCSRGRPRTDRQGRASSSTRLPWPSNVWHRTKPGNVSRPVDLDPEVARRVRRPSRRRRRAAAPGAPCAPARTRSSTPTWSSAPSGTEPGSARRGERRRLRDLGHAEHLAVEPARAVLAAGAARAGRGAGAVTAPPRATTKMRRNGSTVPHGCPG